MQKILLSLIILFLNSLISLGSNDGFYDLSTIKEGAHLANKAKIYELSPKDNTLNNFLRNKKDLHPLNFNEEIPYLDFTNSSYWVELKVENPTEKELNFYIECARTLTNEVSMIILDEFGNEIENIQTGDEYSFNSRMVENRKFIFDIHFKEKTKFLIYIKLKSDGEIIRLPIHFWTVDSFSQFYAKENFFLGFYYGLFSLVIILFSLFGLALREKIYLFFVSYVFVLALFQFSLDGFAFQHLWPNSSWMANHSILIFAALSMISMMLYVSNFIGFNSSLKKYNLGYKILLSLLIISFILSLTEGTFYAISFPLLNYLSFICVLYILVGILIKAKIDKSVEIPVLLAFISLTISSVVFILSNINAIENEFLANNSLKIGSASEVIFLSIAMVGRYRMIQLEKIEAQNEAFTRLEEINVLKSEQTQKLEKQVKERTQEISEKNKVLSEINKDILNSINYAQRLQQAILPTKEELNSELGKVEVLFLPKDIVSGDFYWMVSTAEKVFFAVADCTGHGVPGAMVSVLGSNSLDRCIKEFRLTDPGKILDALTDMIVEAFSNKSIRVSDGMDISLCSWDRKNKLEYAGAYNPLYLIRNGELIEFKGNKQPIGSFENQKPFSTHKIELEKNDHIVLFSDGYADQFGGTRGKKLKYSVFKEYLKEVDKLPISDISLILREKFNNWKGKEAQIDDVCIMNVRF